MSAHDHPKWRLEIGREADALMFYAGPQAYLVACQRAEEASSAEMAKAWSGVAAAIGRRTGTRRSVLDYLIH